MYCFLNFIELSTYVLLQSYSLRTLHKVFFLMCVSYYVNFNFFRVCYWKFVVSFWWHNVCFFVFHILCCFALLPSHLEEQLPLTDFINWLLKVKTFTYK